MNPSFTVKPSTKSIIKICSCGHVSDDVVVVTSFRDRSHEGGSRGGGDPRRVRRERGSGVRAGAPAAHDARAHAAGAAHALRTAQTAGVSIPTNLTIVSDFVLQTYSEPPLWCVVQYSLLGREQVTDDA